MMFKAFGLALCAVLTLAVVDVALAQSADPETDRTAVMRSYCNADAGRRHADLRIGGCTYMINSERPETPNVGARVQRAGAYREMGDLPAAMADYQAALALEPNRAPALIGSAITYRFMGDYMSAAVALGQYRAVTTNQADYWAQLCRLQAVEGRDLNAAEQSCNRSLELQPGYWFPLLNRAMVRLRQGRLDLARADFDAAGGAGTDNTANLALYGRGLIKVEQGQTAEGEADIARATRLYPDALEFFSSHGLRGDYGPWRETKARIRTEIANAASRDWSAWVEMCEGQREGLLIGQTIAGCTLVLRSGRVALANIGLVLNQRARFYAHIGLRYEALQDINHALELEPDNASFLYRRADIQRGRGEPDLALADIDRAIALRPNVPGYLALRADLYVGKGQHARALADWDAVIAMETGNADYYASRGSALLALESYPRAVADYSKALEIAPGNAAYLNLRCWTRALWGRDLPQALEDCEASLRANDDPNTIDSRAAVKLQMGDFEGAYADFDAAYTRQPALTGSLYGRGIAQIRLGRAEAGRADIAQALAVNPNAAASFDRMGQRP